MAWFGWALLAAVAAAVTAILAKVGVSGVPSTTATAIRTVVVLVSAWALVFALGEHRGVSTIPRRSLGFLLLSGLATGISWLAYFRALQATPVTWVTPIDKLSLPLTIVFAALSLREPMNWQVGADDGGSIDDLVLERPGVKGQTRMAKFVFPEIQVTVVNWCALEDSNLRPPPCEGDALPLSQARVR
jgi:bacterial/archaeal transporter family protein